MAVNLSGPWLKKHKWDQLHSQDGVQIDGRLHQLRVAEMEGTEYGDEGTAPAYISCLTTARANSFTKVRLRGQTEADLPDGEYYLTVEDVFMNKTDLHLGVHAMVRSEGGLITAGILNTCLLYTSPSPRDRG